MKLKDYLSWQKKRPSDLLAECRAAGYQISLRAIRYWLAGRVPNGKAILMIRRITNGAVNLDDWDG